MDAEEEYREIIRMKKNRLISNIMRKYLDREMLKTIVQEINKFMEDFIK